VFGDAVIVREGLLTGLRGMDRKKLYIHVAAMQGSVMIEVEQHQIQLEKYSGILFSHQQISFKRFIS